MRAILAEVARLRPEMTAFFGCLYYAALRPEKPLRCAAPTSTGPARAGQADPHRRLPAHRLSMDQHRHAIEPRGLKHRPDGAVRVVPVPPVLAGLLRQHLREYRDRAGRAAVPRRPRRDAQRSPTAAPGTPPRDRARPGAGRQPARPPPLRSAACRLVVVAERHRAPAEVAARAGNSVHVLARCLRALHRRPRRPHQPADRRRPRPGPSTGPYPMRDSQRLYAPRHRPGRCPRSVRG